jgi:hypothetical protein
MWKFDSSWRGGLLVGCAGAAYIVLMGIIVSFRPPDPVGPPGSLFLIPFCTKENNNFLHRCPSSEAHEMPDYVAEHFVVYEDNKPLGPRASIEDIKKLGGGRFSYSRTLGILVSPSNNDNDIMHNHHNYWVVLRPPSASRLDSVRWRAQ